MPAAIRSYTSSKAKGSTKFKNNNQRQDTDSELQPPAIVRLSLVHPEDQLVPWLNAARHWQEEWNNQVLTCCVKKGHSISILINWTLRDSGYSSTMLASRSKRPWRQRPKKPKRSERLKKRICVRMSTLKSCRISSLSSLIWSASQRLGKYFDLTQNISKY